MREALVVLERRAAVCGFGGRRPLSPRPRQGDCVDGVDEDPRTAFSFQSVGSWWALPQGQAPRLHRLHFEEETLPGFPATQRSYRRCSWHLRGRTSQSMRSAAIDAAHCGR